MVCALIPVVSGLAVSQGDAGDCRTAQHLVVAIQGRLHLFYFFSSALDSIVASSPDLEDSPSHHS